VCIVVACVSLYLLDDKPAKAMPDQDEWSPAFLS
jgi:hypothetical protein